MPSSPHFQPASPLGVVMLGRKRPGFDQEWNRVMLEKSLAAMQRLGIPTVGADKHVVDDATLAEALKDVQAAHCQALLVLQPSIGNGQLALTVTQKWQDPIVLWATPERPTDGKVSSCSLVGQHLWASVLRQADHPFEFVYGAPDDPAFQHDLVRAIALCRTHRYLRHAKVGVVGTHVPGFIDLASDPFMLRRKLGIQVHPLSLPQFIDRVRGIDQAAVDEDVAAVRKLGLRAVDVSEDTLDVNSRVYLAMLELMQEESLSALALQCWPEIPNMLGQWPYLAVSRLSSAGHAIAIEGDVDGSITSLMSSSLGIGPGFLTDWLEHDANSVLFWHPGMAPLDMCHAIGSEAGPTLGQHFNIAKPLVVDGQLRPDQDVTVMRLWRCDNDYHMTAFEGRSTTPRRKVTGNSTQVEFGGEPIPERFDRLLHAGMPHHVSLYFGRQAETFRRLARLLQVVWHP